MNLLQIQAALSSGTGNFDEERLLHQLPKDLSLPEKKVHRAIEEQAKDRKRTTLVQAISFLRQKKLDDTVKALNNLVACSKVGLSPFVSHISFAIVLLTVLSIQ